MSNPSKSVKGRNLKVGDTIKVWWNENLHAPDKPQREDTITSLIPYKGPLAHLFKGGARIAGFRYLRSGMTIDCDDNYEVVN